MQIIHPPGEISALTKSLRKMGKTIGLVPTMGALHEGHQALVEQSKDENDVTIISLFVNPTQFDNPDDLARYPRTLENDVSKSAAWGCDIVFAPKEDHIYPSRPTISFDLGKLGELMEGKHRPGHFNGVGLIVLKLFNMVSPDKAYFGMKDYQQYLIIKELVSNLSFPVSIVGVPTVRTPSGLALSSRNRNLSDEGELVAANIYKGLKSAGELILGNRNIDETIKEALRFYSTVEGLTIEYFEIVDASTLAPVKTLSTQPLVICIAAHVENVRLIDNLYLQPD